MRREESSGLKFEEILFDAPSPDEQLGFFHPTNVPVQMYLIRSQQTCPDPFAP